MIGINLFYPSIIKFARFKMQPKSNDIFTILENVDIPYQDDRNHNHLLDIYYP